MFSLKFHCTFTFTPNANVVYEAGNSITLLPGFSAEKTSTFLAEIKGCQ
ncbi:3-coathanger stack domain-containing protein [Runella sp. SP2]|nr:3-coathanger stack domain-containing protein [Runella sp. SP2]